MTNRFEGLSKELLVKNWLLAESDLGLAVEMLEVLVPALQTILEFATFDGTRARYGEQVGFEIIRDLAQTALTESDKIVQEIIDHLEETE